MNYLAQRRQELVRTAKEDGVDAVLVTAAVNVTYLTGFTGEASYFVSSGKGGTLVSDDRFAEQIKEEVAEIDVHIRPHAKTTLQAAVEVLGKGGAKSVGVEANRLTLAELAALQALAPKITFVPLADRVEAQRAVKDPGEVEQIRAAVKVAERAFRMFQATLREADTEKDLSDALENYVRRAGGLRCPFTPITAVGERGALPHAPPTAKTLGEGSKLLVDWGADLGYKSDMTRTLVSPFGTAPTRRNKHERVAHNLEKLYSIVLDAQNAALSAIKDGVKARDVDAAARKVLDKTEYGKYFTHGLGHGIGLEVHEAPRVRANSDDTLRAGMVITVEPGVYIPGWGGVRIEDDVLVTRDGCTVLSTLPRDLATLTLG